MSIRFAGRVVSWERDDV